MGALACPAAPSCAWIFGSEGERADHVKAAHPGIALADPTPAASSMIACGVGDCEAKFSTKQAAAGHRFAKHKVRADGSSAGAVRPTTLTPHRCKVLGCERSFATSHGLEVHVARTHRLPSREVETPSASREEPMGEPHVVPGIDFGSDGGVYVSKDDREALVELLASIIIPNAGGSALHVGDLTEKQRRTICLYDQLVGEE